MTAMLVIGVLGLVVALPGAALAAVELHGRWRKWHARRKLRAPKKTKRRK
jgi:hypothetical protein